MSLQAYWFIFMAETRKTYSAIYIRISGFEALTVVAVNSM
jgi:hypothetical protein